MSAQVGFPYCWIKACTSLLTVGTAIREAALRVTAATLDAARGFRNGPLPEFIAGAERLPGDAPTHTPRADPLQARSAAAMPFMVSELLGLDADGLGNSLHIRRPLLPDGVDALVLHRVSISNAAVSLRFTRHADGASATVIANPAASRSLSFRNRRTRRLLRVRRWACLVADYEATDTVHGRGPARPRSAATSLRETLVS